MTAKTPPLNSILSPNSAPRIFAVANQKGGVGKTTTAVNLSTALCAVGARVLLIDMDPQGNATTGLGVAKTPLQKGVYEVLFGEVKAFEAVQQTKIPRLSIIASSVDLSGAEVELVSARGREYRLRDALRTGLAYDYIIIDCPPSLNFLTLNALVAAHAIIVPLQCEFYALEGLSQLTKTVKLVQKQLNPQLDIHGVVLTMYDRRNRLTRLVADDVRGYFGDKVYRTTIPRNVRLSEAPSYGLPAIVYDMNCAGAQSYIMLAKEVIGRENALRNENEDNKNTEVA